MRISERIRRIAIFAGGILIGLSILPLVRLSIIDPWHDEVYRLESPDHQHAIVVDRYYYNNQARDVPWRIFRVRSSDSRVEDQTYRIDECASGAVDMSDMRVYWLGNDGVVAFGNRTVLRWGQMTGWRFSWNYPPFLLPDELKDHQIISVPHLDS